MLITIHKRLCNVDVIAIDDVLQSRFKQDSFVCDGEDYFVLSYGVIVNSRQLKAHSAEDNWIVAAYKKFGDDFFKHFNGSFCGILIDKKQHKTLVYTNHVGDKKLFYTQLNDVLIVGDNVFDVLKQCRLRGKEIELSTPAVYGMLTYGQLFHSNTLFRNVSRLYSGQYLLLKQGSVQQKTYYKPNNEPDRSLKMVDAVEHVDDLFNKAIIRNFEKDNEIQTKHLVALSGGLDARCNVWLAKEQGFKNIHAYTFGSDASLDVRLSAQIAKYLDIEWESIRLPEGDHLLSFEEIVRVCSATCMFQGPAASFFGHQQLSFEGKGLLHSGQLGGATMSSYCRNDSEAYGSDNMFEEKMLSHRFKHKFELPEDDSGNNEMYFVRNRGFNHILCGYFPIQVHTETLSPFLDHDVLDFLLHVPVALRANHKLYKKWIISKHPNIATIRWEKYNARITHPMVQLGKYSLPLAQLPYHATKAVLKRLHINVLKQTNSKNNLTPYGLWFKNNEQLLRGFQNYHEKYLDLVSDVVLRQDMNDQFILGNHHEKMQVITVLAALKIANEN